MSSDVEAELERRLKAQYEPAKAEKRSYSPAPISSGDTRSYAQQAGRRSLAPLREAFLGPVAKAAGLALALVLTSLGTVVVSQLEGCASSSAAVKELRERDAAQQKQIDSLTTELPVLREATLGATGRSKRVARVQREQAEWLCSYLRMFEGIGCLVEGAPKEPPLLTLGTAPLGPGEPLVIRPPTRIIETPVPAGEAEPDRAPQP